MENKRKQFGFTLVELVVAIGILVLMIGFASMLFRITIETRRLTGANAEISQKFKTIAEQLNRDVKRIQKDAPVFIWFQKDGVDDSNRFDQIMFFANGNFQSQRAYDNNSMPSLTGTPLIGIAARIYYGQAVLRDSNSVIYPQQQIFDRSPHKIEHHKAKTLARQQYIYCSDPNAKWYGPDFFAYDQLYGTSIYLKKDYFETDSNDISQWKSTDFSNYVNNNVIAATFDRRAYIDFKDPDTIHNIFCEGVGSFGIQLAYKWADTIGDTRARWFWYPSTDPNDDGNFSMKSHFWLVNPNADKFGTYFNVQNPVAAGLWYDIQNLEYYNNGVGQKFGGYFPKAIKFTFRIYDSKGIIKNGRLFTHIVYLGD
jgi:type II secretory pathway pseudopilin PulG